MNNLYILIKLLIYKKIFKLLNSCIFLIAVRSFVKHIALGGINLIGYLLCTILIIFIKVS